MSKLARPPVFRGKIKQTPLLINKNDNKHNTSVMSKLVALLLSVVISLVGFGLWNNKYAFNSGKRSYLTAKHEFSITDASSFWVVVNKQRPLSPKTYVPSDLVVPDVPHRSNITDDESKTVYVVAEQLKNMTSAAAQQGVALELESGYRSFEFQQKIHDNYSKEQGEAEANTSSALPGYSEHQTGLAIDIGSANNSACNVRPCFATTPEAGWIAANAYKYGFIIRYPKDKQNMTGYEYEPWHLRYVGIYLANQMKSKNIATLEEFFKQSQS